MAKVIAFANQKGGVAKTTLSVNVASALARLGKRTLLIDMDPQGAASDAAGFREHRDDTLTLIDWYRHPEPIMAAKHIFATNQDDLDLFPATMKAMDAEVVLARDSLPASYIQKFLKTPFVKDRYEYVIIDTPPNLDINFNNAIMASDFVLIPVTPEMKTVRGLSNLQESLDKLMKNCVSRVLGLVITKVQSNINTHKRVLAFYNDHYADQLFVTQISNTKDFPEADERGHLSVISHNPAGKSAEIILDLTEEIIAKIESIGNGRRPRPRLWDGRISRSFDILSQSIT